MILRWNQQNFISYSLILVDVFYLWLTALSFISLSWSIVLNDKKFYGGKYLLFFRTGTQKTNFKIGYSSKR